MSVNLANLYAQQYAMNCELLLQQKDSRLRSYVTQGSYIGEQAAVVDQLGEIAMQDVVGKFGAMGRVDNTTDRRWVLPSSFDLPQLIDSIDSLKLLSDPSSKYVMAAVSAAKRKMDDVILDACFGTSKTGKTGSTPTTFPSGQQVAVDHGASGNTNLTVAKLREARKLLRAAEVDLDMDPVTVVITASQEDSLLSEAQIISLDYNDRPVLKDGKIMSFLGMNFVHCERVGADANAYRRVPVFAKSGLHMGIWNDIKTDVSQRKDIQNLPWQAYVYMTIGATRTEEEKVVEIKCAE